MDTISILRGLKETYEAHHGVHLLDAALISAAQLADRWERGSWFSFVCNAVCTLCILFVFLFLRVLVFLFLCTCPNKLQKTQLYFFLWVGDCIFPHWPRHPPLPPGFHVFPGEPIIFFGAKEIFPCAVLSLLRQVGLSTPDVHFLSPDNLSPPR